MHDWIFKDLHWKAFSILMAVGIWLMVHRISAEPEKQTGSLPSVRNTYDLPLMAVSANADVRRAQLSPAAVNVTIGGPSGIMDNLKGSQIHAYVNLTGYASVQNLPLNIEISLPPGASILEIKPRQANVTLPRPLP